MRINGYDYISEDDFDGIYGASVKPNGELFSYQEAIQFPLKQVWTVYEDGSIDEAGYSDNTWYAMPGVVPAHALGYLITEKSWDEDTHDAIWYLGTDEKAREERRLDYLKNG